MGTAFKAFDRKLKRTVALKILHSAFYGAPNWDRRLLHEARAAAALSHPNICTIHAIAESDGVSFIVMEFVKGRTLNREIELGRIDPLRLAALAVQVVEALAEAHQHGIVHRDIKPANIIVADDGQVKVLDFGLATIAPTGDLQHTVSTAGVMSSSGKLEGTLAYMSPEQAEAITIDGRSDIFSLGIVLYECATGINPFIGPNHVATLARILSAAVPPIRNTVPNFPEQLEKVILRCLAKSRDDRYATTTALRRDLARRPAQPLWRRRDVVAIPSLAVIPFVNLSGETSDGYLTDGIASELTSRLAQAGELLVISRTSTLRYKSNSRDIREVGAELGVRSLVDGTVQIRGETCVLLVNLIDVTSGFHVWAGRYETTLEGLVEVQVEIVQKILVALRMPAPQFHDAHLSLGVDRKGLELYSRAEHAYHKFTDADSLIAIELLQHAIAHDGSQARPLALLASVCLARVERGWESNVAEWLARASAASSEALQLDPEISEAYAARGLISFFSSMNDEAEADAREALRSDNNNDIAHDLLGRVRFSRGEFLGAISAFRDALAINPYSVWCLNDLAWALLIVGVEDEAIRTLDRVLQISPRDEGGHCGKAAFYLVRGPVELAFVEIQKANDTNPRYPFVLQLLPPILARIGKVGDAIAYCNALTAHPSSAYFGYASLGLVCAEVGDTVGMRDNVSKALQLVPFSPALNLSYATLFDAVGQVEIAESWVAKGVRDGIKLTDVAYWDATLKRLAVATHLTSSENANA